MAGVSAAVRGSKEECDDTVPGSPPAVASAQRIVPLADLLVMAETEVQGGPADTRSQGEHADATPDEGTGLAADSSSEGLLHGQRYVFSEPFASGGLGVVRRAEDRLLGRTVAVKELLRGNPASRRRFLREAAITARLQHPGIVPLYDFGRHASGEPFYCMKLVDGRTLESAIGESKALAERLGLVGHVIAAAEAVAYAHQQGVIHRDLKPANILIGELGETVVIDWGIAKDLSGELGGDSWSAGALEGEAAEDLTQAGMVLGTLRYMAPEQARGEALDVRCDVYALGAVLYTVLAGVPPFAGLKGGELRMAVTFGRPAELISLVPGGPRELVAIVEKAMANDPEARYPDARALAEDLRRFVTGRLVGAHHYSAGEVMRRWLRQRWVFVAAFVAVLVITGVIGGVAVQNIRRERDSANDAFALAEAEQASANLHRSMVRAQLASTLIGQANDAVADRSANEALVAASKALVLGEDATARGAAIAGASGLLQPLRWSARLAGEPTMMRWHPVAGLLVATAGRVERWDAGGTVMPPLSGPAVRDPKYGLAVSPSGRRIALRSGARVVVFDAEKDLEAPVVTLEIGPLDLRWLDEDRLIAGSDRGVHEIGVWDVASGRRLGGMRGHENYVRALAVQPGGTLVVSGSHDGTIRAWDPSRLQEVGPLEAAGVGAYAIDVSPDGALAAVVGEVMGGDGKVRVWNLRTNALQATFQAHTGEATAVAFSADGRWLASGGRDGAVRVWHVPDFTLAGMVRRADAGAPVFAFSPEGEALAVAWTGEARLRVWSLAAGEHGLPPEAFARPVERVAWSPDGTRLAVEEGGRAHVVARARTTPAGDADAHTLVWGAEGLVTDLRGGVGEAVEVLGPPSPGGARVLVRERGVGLRLLGLDGAREPGPAIDCGVDDEHELVQGRAVWWPDGSAVLFGTASGVMQVTAEDLRCVAVGPLDTPTDALAIDRTGTMVAAHTGEAIALFEAPSWAPRGEIVVEREHRNVSAMTFTRDGRWLLVAHLSGKVSAWSVERLRLRARWQAHDNRIWSMELAPDGRTLATGSGDRTARTWELEGLDLEVDALVEWAEARTGERVGRGG